jgi:Protein of unknown function (DUF2970)
MTVDECARVQFNYTAGGNAFNSEAKEIFMTPLSGNSEPDARPVPKKATLLQVARIVGSALFMIGRNRDYGPAAPTIGPARLVIVALIGTALVIATLVLLATFIAH